MSNIQNCRPLKALEDIGKKFPLAWKLTHSFRSGRGKGLPLWPEWCYLPLAASAAIVTQNTSSHQEMLDAAVNISRLGALAAWRMTKGIYRFDPDVLEDLKDTTLVDEIPNEIFFRLPEWCVYCETPGMTWMNMQLFGMWVHLEWDVNTERHELRFLLDTNDDGLIPVILHLGHWTLSEGIKRATNEAKKHGPGIFDQIGRQFNEISTNEIQPLVSMILYLCSQSSEINSKTGGSEGPGNPVEKAVKGGPRLFPKDKISTWNVGVRMGVALRTSKRQRENTMGESASAHRTHIRRAHWHMFRFGPMKDQSGTQIPTTQRQYNLKWLHPILVNAEQTNEELPATIRKVT